MEITRTLKCACGSKARVKGSSTSLLTMSSDTICLECGDKLREQEQRKREQRREALLARFAANS